MRAELSKLLIKERGFAAVVVEADFPDAFRANLYARGLSSTDMTAEQALRDFKRFPTWMWRNSVVTEFIEWLKRHNDKVRDGVAPRPNAPGARGVSFLGMDVYSLHSSAAKVIEFLSVADPDAADIALKRYACFDRYGADTMHYAYAVGMGGAPSCAPAALAQLKEVVEKAAGYGAAIDGELGEELAFAARCNAAVVTGAEAYYRNMFFGEDLTWNLRDRHFADTVAAIRDHLSRPPGARDKPGPWAGGPPARLVLWAHNSHLGDASATDMGWKRGEINVGQLVRERLGLKATYNIGFTTNHGTVAAADDWDTPVQRKSVRKGMPGSFEHLFHKCGMPEFALDLRQGSSDLREALEGPLLERAIGVVYRPRTERQSHYFYASLPAQFDCVVHVDDSLALTPLEKTGAWETDEHAREDAPETYPFGV
ncbi:erythromycin esterase [Micractinium conductrix]|uniref:Erythromycin esterase n=1 Tax=Micractinium conductrix TaxID=554055 RepID=A0A2P6VG87_9CHLO|nr:erythromycin esterase [Micractinium conductrix]|eukprot:PSC73112.1 erythromycin esterase [Micractinium conductrix]